MEAYITSGVARGGGCAERMTAYFLFHSPMYLVQGIRFSNFALSYLWILCLEEFRIRYRGLRFTATF